MTRETETDLEIPRASEFALSALDIAESTAVEIPAPVQEVPRTLAEAYAKLRELNAAPPSPDKTLRKAHAVLLERARADVFRLSQSPTPPPIDHAAFLKREPSPEAVARIRSLYPNAKKS
jgi:hypothetical protein